MVMMNIQISRDVAALSTGCVSKKNVSSTKYMSIAKCFEGNYRLHFQGFALVPVYQSRHVVAVYMPRPGTFTPCV
jgi:hypothetical protein